MEVKKKSLSDTQVELDINLNPADMQPYFEHVARHLSAARPIPGFRPGKATFEVAKKHFGMDLIFKESLDEIINGSLNKAVAQENVRAFEEGDFKLLTQTPENIHYTISFTILPQVTLGDWQAKKITRKEVTVSDEEVNEALNDLTKMLAKENVVERAAAMGDKTVLDFEVSVDGKVIDGGVGKSYPITLGEKKMIPGFEEAVVGHVANDEFEFKLNFPKDYSAGLGGKEATFKIKVHSVMERVSPELNDELAKSLGETDKAALVARLTENIKNEKMDREQERLEIEAVKTVVDSIKLGTIPPKAITQEIQKLTQEFEHTLAHQGQTMENYLKMTNKQKSDIEKEFEPKAMERVKTSLVVSQIIDENNLEVTKEELEAEIKDQQEYFATRNPQAVSEVDKPEYRRYLYNRLINRKAIRFITEKLTQ
jgi:trigger factor